MKMIPMKIYTTLNQCHRCHIFVFKKNSKKYWGSWGKEQKEKMFLSGSCIAKSNQHSQISKSTFIFYEVYKKSSLNGLNMNLCSCTIFMDLDMSISKSFWGSLTHFEYFKIKIPNIPRCSHSSSKLLVLTCIFKYKKAKTSKKISIHQIWFKMLIFHMYIWEYFSVQQCCPTCRNFLKITRIARCVRFWSWFTIKVCRGSKKVGQHCSTAIKLL